MPNPFGITEVNLPQIFAGAQQVQESRIRNMILNQQLQAAERAEERQQGIRQIIAGAMARPTPSGAGQQSGGGGASPRSLADVAQAFGQPDVAWGPQQQEAPAAPAAPAQAAQPRINMRDLFGQLVGAGMDVGEARQTAQMVAGADPQQLQMLQQRSQALASVLLSARRLPMADRAAFIQRAAPQLAEFGIDAATIDPSDQNLDAQIALGTPIAQALEASRPQYRNAQAGDTVLDMNQIDPSTGRARVVYESPYMRGPGGEIFERNGSGAAAPEPVRVQTPAEARRLPPGTPIILPDGSAGVVPGGPSQPATGGFR